MTEFITEHWLSIGTGIFLLGMVLYGHYRGFLRIAVSLAALILSTVIVRMAMPYITTYVRENTQIQQMVEQSVVKSVGLEQLQENVQLPAEQRQIIEQLQLPEQLKDMLLENNNSEIYRLLGVDSFLKYIGSYLSNTIINMIGSAIIFGAAYFAIRMLVRWIDLFSRLPIISGMNQIAGAILGGVQGLLIIWIGCLAIRFFSQRWWAQAALEQIQGSIWLQFLYQNNLINWILISILKSLI